MDINKNSDLRDELTVFSDCLGFIDLTSLNSTDTVGSIASMVDKVNRFQQAFPGHKQVAAMCVYPNFAKTVKERLSAEGVKIAVVAGVFPSSQSFIEVKSLECEMAVEQGADEVDIVLSLNYFLEERYNQAAQEIAELKRACGDAHLKVILESGTLKEQSKIYKASMLAMESGADFIKTSTGKTEPAATPEAAEIMCEAILDFYNKSGKRVGFKPAGGIVTPEDALKYYNIVRTKLGCEWLNSSLFRLGASRLANNLLSRIEGKEINFF